ncbi:reverse transcriptase domain-containing protein [Ferruginivarius sediminum]|nr:reverse transcriptase domain-containing protein [Ferruginivarius sediminum]
MPGKFGNAKVSAKHRQKAAKLHGRLGQAAACGDVARTRETRKAFLNSFSARAVAVAEAARKKDIKLTCAEAEKLASTLDPRIEPQETVRLTWKVKSDQSYRPIFRFDLRRTALQRLLAHAIHAEHDLHPGQHGVPGKGRNEAIRKAKDYIDAGYSWVVSADVKNCFGSLDAHEVAHRLNLPHQFRHILLPPSGDHIVIPHDNEGKAGKKKEVVTGRLPQGSAASPVAAAAMLAPVYGELPACIAALGYVDDIALFCQSYGDAVSAYNALRGALQGHQAGPLHLKYGYVRQAHDGFRFLGYWIWSDVHGARARPTDAKLEDLDQKLIACDAGGGKDRRTVARDILRGWLSAFREWDLDEYGITALVNICNPHLKAVDVAAMVAFHLATPPKDLPTHGGAHYVDLLQLAG